MTGDTGECHQWSHWPHSVKIGDKLPSIYLSSSYSVEIYLEYHSKSWKTFQVWDYRLLTFQVCSGHIRCEFPRRDCCLCFRKVEDTGLLKRNIFDNNWEIYLTISEKYDILQELDFQNLRNTLPPVFRWYIEMLNSDPEKRDRSFSGIKVGDRSSCWKRNIIQEICTQVLNNNQKKRDCGCSVFMLFHTRPAVLAMLCLEDKSQRRFKEKWLWLLRKVEYRKYM